MELPSIYQNLVILTGAGISAESGIRTFRDQNGLWEDHPIEEVATPEGFRADPDKVWKFYNERRSALAETQPNPAHLAIAEMEQIWKGSFLLITQNVDDLHQKAGSKQIIPMHGELCKARCSVCDSRQSLEYDAAPSITCEQCQSPLRPHIVWFGEIPLELNQIYSKIGACDWFIVIGSSGLVYPAAGFVSLAKNHGAKTMGINSDPGTYHPDMDFFHCAKAGEFVPELMNALKAKHDQS